MTRASDGLKRTGNLLVGGRGRGTGARGLDLVVATREIVGGILL